MVIVRQLLPPSELARLRQSVDEYIEYTVPKKDTNRVFTTAPGDLSTLQYFASPVEHGYLDALGSHPRWRHLAAVCLGETFADESDPNSMSGKGRPEVQYFNKVPGRSLHTPAHQDNFYFKLDPPSCLTIWMALDHIDPGNGLLRYCPGSHRGGVLRHESSHVLGFSQHIADYAGRQAY